MGNGKQPGDRVDLIANRDHLVSFSKRALSASGKSGGMIVCYKQMTAGLQHAVPFGKSGAEVREMGDRERGNKQMAGRGFQPGQGMIV